MFPKVTFKVLTNCKKKQYNLQHFQHILLLLKLFFSFFFIKQTAQCIVTCIDLCKQTAMSKICFLNFFLAKNFLVSNFRQLIIFRRLTSDLKTFLLLLFKNCNKKLFFDLSKKYLKSFVFKIQRRDNKKYKKYSKYESHFCKN